MNALARLIEARRKQHGTYIGNARELFDFYEWLEGVRDGLSVERTPKQGPLL